jgi:DNA-binding transcriptional LysR family regulator
MAELDLNLLRVFDTLMDQRSVTGAAGRLGLTQSAVSHALGRLRTLIGDPLFVRSPGGLRPTARAEEIAPGIREGLVQLRGALDPPDFVPARATRRFTIATGSYFCELLVPRLVERLQIEAPGVSLRVVPITETMDRALDRGTVDLVLGGTVKAAARFLEETLFDEEMVWIAATDNPASLAPHDLSRLCDLPRVLIAVHRPLDLPTAIENELAQIFPTLRMDADRSVGDPLVSVYDAQTAIAVVARTNSVAIVPRRLAIKAVATGQILILSESTATAPLSMLWHNKQQTDPGLAWFRATIRACLS